MNILRAAVVVAGFSTFGAAMAGPVVSSSVETGWTSNAEQAAGGKGDFFLTHRHAAGFGAEGEGFALRGTIGVEATHYLRLWRENDWQGTLTLEGEMAAGAQGMLRGSFALSYGEEGRALATLLGPLGAVTPQASLSAGLRYETLVGETGLGMALSYQGKRHGETRFEADVLAPLRMNADSDTIGVGADFTHPLSASIALLGGAQWRAVAVDAEDQELFGRVPAQLARLSGGAGFADGTGTALTLRAGFDALMPEGMNAILLPFGEAQGRLQLGGSAGVFASLAAGVDLDKPADGLADWALAARGGFDLSPAPGWGVEAALFAGEKRSAALDVSVETEAGGEARLRYGIAGLILEGGVLYRRVWGLTPAYDETRVALRVAASL